jgi:hypothetical protein
MVLAATLLAPTRWELAAQVKAPPIADNQLYLGAMGGVLIFETPTQTRGAIALAGGQAYISIHRAGLLLQVMEGFGGGAQSTQFFQTQAGGAGSAAGALAQVGFHDIRIYNAMLVATPIRSLVQPYFGLGLAFVQIVNPSPTGAFINQGVLDNTQNLAERVGNYGAGSALAGLQFRVDRFALFGQAQMFTGAPKKTLIDQVGDSLKVTGEGSLLTGSSFTFMAGLRIGLGGARSAEAIRE